MKNVFDLNEDEKKAGVFCRVVREENELRSTKTGCEKCSFGEFENQFVLCDGCHYRNGLDGYYLTLADMEERDIIKYIGEKTIDILEECLFLSTQGVKAITYLLGTLIATLDCSLDEKVEVVMIITQKILEMVKENGE